MNIHDDMSDDDVLRAAATSLSALPVAGPPAAEAIMSRGRARRRHTVTGVGLAGTVGVTALALGLAGVFGGHSPARAGTTIRTAAFTLTRNANGTDTLTISPVVLVEPGTLQKDLAQDGIEAMVHTGSFCSSNPAPDWSQVMSFSPQGNGPVQNPTITINPSAMPAGTELSFGYFQLPVGQKTALALINTNSYTCTSTAPTAPPVGGALFGRSLPGRTPPQAQFGAPGISPRGSVKFILSSELGLPAERRPAEQEAVGAYRELATAYPTGTGRPGHLASVLGLVLDGLGRTAEAEAA